MSGAGAALVRRDSVKVNTEDGERVTLSPDAAVVLARIVQAHLERESARTTGAA